MTGVTRDELVDELRRLDPACDPDSNVGRAALTLLAGVIVGASIKKIAKLLRLRRATVAEYSRRLRECGVWVGERTYANWLDSKVGGIEFWMDVGVATGMLTTDRRGTHVRPRQTEMLPT